MQVKSNTMAVPSTGILSKLHGIQIGGSSGVKIRRKDLIAILRNLVTLVTNGVSIVHGLETLSQDKHLRRYRSILKSLSDSVRNGDRLSTAMKRFPKTFPELMVHQIEVGERAGTLAGSLNRVTIQLEDSSNLKSFLIKKLTYPMILVVAGCGAVTFMMLCVIPTFQKMYEESGATLPWITELLIGISTFVATKGWMVAAGIAATVTSVVVALKNPANRRAWDRMLMKLPILGDWFRNIAILQFIEVMGNLMESGFLLVDALPAAASGVKNTYVRSHLQSLHAAIRRGDRFSLAIEKEKELFPPVVKQLVVVGEQTGKLVHTTKEIRVTIRRDVENYTSAMLGAIEPILTAVLALVVGGILLAVYLPMFDMIGQTGK